MKKITTDDTMNTVTAVFSALSTSFAGLPSVRVSGIKQVSLDEANNLC